jgi:ABC-type phosphate transport system substrate-binding protein
LATALARGVEVAKSGGIAVIVNADNPFPRPLPISSLRALFLGDTRRLGRQKAIPTLTQDKEALATFYATLLETSESAFKSQWLKKVFSDGLQPPVQMKTSLELIEWVRRTPNGVAVLPARDALNKKGDPLPGLAVVLVVQ